MKTKTLKDIKYGAGMAVIVVAMWRFFTTMSLQNPITWCVLVLLLVWACIDYYLDVKELRDDAWKN